KMFQSAAPGSPSPQLVFSSSLPWVTQPIFSWRWPALLRRSRTKANLVRLDAAFALAQQTRRSAPTRRRAKIPVAALKNREVGEPWDTRVKRIAYHAVNAPTSTHLTHFLNNYEGFSAGGCGVSTKSAGRSLRQANELEHAIQISLRCSPRICCHT